MTIDPSNLEVVVALADLSMDEREALFDHVVRYETYREIGERLGVTPQAVAEMVARGKRKLRKALTS